MKQYPSQARLRELFDYDPEGFLVWKERGDVGIGVNTRFAGERAGCIGVGTIEREEGFRHYAEIRVNGTLYRQHVLVWIWHKGPVPEGKTVTHRSGIVLVSKIEDLITVDSRSSKPWQRNKRFLEGLVGVRERKGKHRNTYKAVDSEGSHIGTFTKREAAAAAYNQYAKDRWGDHAILNDVKCPDFEKYRTDAKLGGQSKKKSNGVMLGCYYDKINKTWYSKIGNEYIGTFYTEEQAARAYNIAAKKYYGDLATINEIPNPLTIEPVFIPKPRIKGVQKKGKRFTCIFERKTIGTYDTEVEAARKYNLEALKKYGNLAHVNDVENPFEDPGSTVLATTSSSGLRGVHSRKSGRYAARFKKKNLGTFSSKEQAARAYNIAAREHYGEHAVLNDIPDPLGKGDIF